MKNFYEIMGIIVAMLVLILLYVGLCAIQVFAFGALVWLLNLVMFGAIGGILGALGLNVTAFQAGLIFGLGTLFWKPPTIVTKN